MKFLLISPKNRTVYNFRGDLIRAIIAKGYEVVVTGPDRTDVDRIEALGVLETWDVAAMIAAADVAAKTAIVSLLELRLAKGMCGKSYMTLTGSVSAVQAAIDSAKEAAGDKGMFLDEAVIPRPSDRLMPFIF